MISKRQALHRLIANIKENQSSLFFWCFVYTLAAVIYPVVGVVMPKVLIDGLMSDSPSIALILKVVIAFFVASVIMLLVKNMVEGFQNSNIMRLRINYAKDQAVRLMTMDYEHTEDATFYEKYDRAFTSIASNSNGIEGVYNALWEIPAFVLTAIVLSIIMGSKSIIILVAIVINVGVGMYAADKVQKLRYEHKNEQAKARRRLKYYTATAQDFSYGKDIRLYHLKDRLIDNFKKEMKQYVELVTRIANGVFRWDLLLLIALVISDATIYGILVYKALHGMSIADFSMNLSVVLLLSSTLKSIAEKFAFISDELLYIVDFFRFMEDELGTEGGTHKATAAELPLKVEFKQVSFKYPGTEQWIFRKLNLVIPAGQRLAIVGINGAGKTTLVKLMMGLFKVNEGEILINDVNIREYNKKELAKMFAAVFQDVNILGFTVEENIAGSSESIDESRVDLVLKKVGLKEVIEEFPKQKKQPMLKVIEEDGIQLSGGQNQKLAIARALYKGGNMVIMDEPTAALDALAEAEIYEDFAGLVKGKTAVYISHRLASTRFCDKIAFFDGDGLSEYGSHEELMRLKGKYYEMFTVQGRYYQKEIAG